VTSLDAYARLRELILSGVYQPNQRLVEAELTGTLGASRAAVRTALVRLTQEGLIEHERHRGARVRMVGEQEAAEVLEARAALEALAVRSAAERATPKDVDELREILAGMRARLDAGDLLGTSDLNAVLHARLLALAAHATASRLVAALNGQLVRFQYRTILVPGRSERSYAEHAAIVDAVAAGDADAAEAAMRWHLGHVTQALRGSRQRISASTLSAPSPTAS
jgi:DNA-binding GntR family transcriptional regulator